MNVPCEDQDRFVDLVHGFEQPFALVQKRGKTVSFIVFVVSSDMRRCVVDRPGIRRYDENETSEDQASRTRAVRGRMHGIRLRSDCRA